MVIRFPKKTRYLFMLLIAFSLVPFISLSTKKRLPEAKPKDFSFVFNYGINAKNQLDTVNEQYTKDMVNQSSITTDLKLTYKEMNTIYVEMRRINILGYPKNFMSKNNTEWSTSVTPFETYSIKIIVNGREKNITWEDENISNAEEAVQLRKLFKMIEEMINNKEEFKKLPVPQSHYN
jgi:hypothetical protein